MAKDKKELVVLSPEEEQALEDKRKSSALTGFIFSLLSWFQGTSLFGFVFAIIGLVFSIVGGKVKSPNHRSFKTVGRTLSIIQIVLYIVLPIIAFCAVMCFIVIYAIIVVIVLLASGALGSLN